MSFPKKPTPRWTYLKHHAEQKRLYLSKCRFKTVPAGRRSGKTENAKRYIVERALSAPFEIKFPPPYNFFVGAPTRDQAKRIYWNDLKLLTPKADLLGKPNESQLIISLKSFANIHVLGMDKPERIEGSPWDGGILDEYGNMKKQTWGEHVRPALSDRLGWCWFIGVPEGRNHYYDLDRAAKADETGEWDSFWWESADILPSSEIEAAKRDLDELTFAQEYQGSFVNFSGLCYYNFNERLHCDRLFQYYDPKNPLILMLDFNRAPGVAVIAQEMQVYEEVDDYDVPVIGETITCIIGEVYIPRNSNTQIVCDKFCSDWGKHEGRVEVYGDATGGNKHSSSIQGSDWEIVKKILYKKFGEKLVFKVPTTNPFERDRVNAVNSRLYSLTKEVHLMVDPHKAPYVVKDFEGVSVIEGGSGEIDKKKDLELTHLTDAVGYYIEQKYPIRKRILRYQSI